MAPLTFSDGKLQRRTFPEKVASRLYKLTSGISANTLRFDLEELTAALSGLSSLVETEILAWEDLFSPNQDSRELADLFNKYGSDKSTRHNYDLIYASLLKRNDPINIFEIGLGTNNTKIPFNMGAAGKPGAAERAFRDWAPESRIFGADVDRAILFSEERIQTYFVDQTRPETLAALAVSLPPLDLVIDDGLHTPRANLNTIAFALPLLKENGTIVIEDILPEHLSFWKVAIAILSDHYRCRFVKMKTEHVVMIAAPQVRMQGGESGSLLRGMPSSFEQV